RNSCCASAPGATRDARRISGRADAHKKAGRNHTPPGFSEKLGCRLRSVTLQLDDFVLDAEFLALQIGDRIPVWQRTPILLIDGALQFSMLSLQRLDAILRQHAYSSC